MGIQKVIMLVEEELECHNNSRVLALILIQQIQANNKGNPITSNKIDKNLHYSNNIVVVTAITMLALEWTPRHLVNHTIKNTVAVVIIKTVGCLVLLQLPLELVMVELFKLFLCLWVICLWICICHLVHQYQD